MASSLKPVFISCIDKYTQTVISVLQNMTCTASYKNTVLVLCHIKYYLLLCIEYLIGKRNILFLAFFPISLDSGTLGTETCVAILAAAVGK